MFTLPEFVTFALYAITVSLLLTALAARHEIAQKVTAVASLIVGALATYCLVALFSGTADGWFEDEARRQTIVEREQAKGGQEKSGQAPSPARKQ